MGFDEVFDVIVIGAGHAGCEAASASARARANRSSTITLICLGKCPATAIADCKGQSPCKLMRSVVFGSVIDEPEFNSVLSFAWVRRSSPRASG